MGFSGGASGKEPAFQFRRHKRCGFHPWVRRFPGGGHGHLLQYSCLENPIDRGARHATVPRVTNSQTRLKQLSMHTCKSWAWRLKSIFHSANFVWSQLQQQREICPKSFRQVFSSMWSKNFERYMLGLAEAAKPEIKLLTFVISQRNQGNSKKKKKIYFFTEYTKVFDCVDHNKLWKILKEIGIPDHLTCLLRNPCVGQ